MDVEQSPAESTAAEREAETHGCCCLCCKLIWELYFALGLDTFILVCGAPPLFETNTPVPYRAWLGFYLFAVVIPSICFFTYAIKNGNKSGGPRLLLTRFLVFWKIPVYFLMYSLFFTVSPWAAEVDEFMCDPKNDFEHGKVSKFFEHNGTVNVPECVAGVPKIMVPAMIPRLIIYCYSIKGAWEYMRCHPDNDGKSLCSSGAKAQEISGGYEVLAVA